MDTGIIPRGWDRDRLKQALGLAYNDPENFESIAISLGVPPDAVLELLNTDEGEKVGLMSAKQMQQDGTLLKMQALKPLEKLVAQVEQRIDAGDVSTNTAVRLLDVLFKMTGLAEERAARLRVEAERDKPMATIIVLKPGDPDPEPAKENEARVVIDLRGKHRQSNVIDVTPNDDEGGE